MFVVRSGASWDDPSIEFLTDNEEIAKAVLAERRKNSFKKQLKFQTSWATSQRAKYNLAKLTVEAPTAKEILGEDEYNHLVEQLDDLRISAEHAEKSLEEYTINKIGKDWFYEEVPVINNLDEALQLPNVSSEFLSHSSRDKRVWE